MTSSSVAGPPAPYDGLARLLLGPAEHGVHTRNWDVSELADLDGGRLLWGAAGGSSRGRGRALKQALRREAALVRLRTIGAHGFRLERVLRVASTGPRGRRATDPIRRVLYGGAFAQLARDAGTPTTLDLVLRDAGVVAVGRPRVTAGGSLLQPVHRGTQAAMLRVGAAGTMGDPAWAARGLAAVAARRDFPAPAPVGGGLHGSLSWTLESRLPGESPRRMTPALFREVVAALSRLPVTDRAAGEAARDHLDTLTEWFPERRERLEAWRACVVDGLAGVPAVLGHGDLWVRNLLATRGRLTGVVDWDAWTDGSAPGTDLLQLFATAWRAELREPLGAVWRRRPWDRPAFHAHAARYWGAFGINPSPSYLEALGIAWWAQEVVGTLRRIPIRRHDPAWVSANVLHVLDHRGCT